MKIICASVLGLLIAAIPTVSVAAQRAPFSAQAPARSPGAAPYEFPGQWEALGDADGGQENVIAFFVDRARTRRTGNILSAVWIAIDEKNIDAVRTNVYETEFDCAASRTRRIRVQNYDAANFPLVTPSRSGGGWEPTAPGSTVAAIRTTLCNTATRLRAVSNVQAAALEAFSARRQRLAATALPQSAGGVGRPANRPVAALQQIIATSVADNPVQLNHQYRPVPGKFVTYRASAQGCVTRIDIQAPAYVWDGQNHPAAAQVQTFDWSRGGRAYLGGTPLFVQYDGPAVLHENRLFAERTPEAAIRLRDAINGLIAACSHDNPQSRADAGVRPTGAPVSAASPVTATAARSGPQRPPPNANVAARWFGSALEGAPYPVGEGNQPGQYHYVRTVSACVTVHRIDMPARTISGRSFAASTSEYTTDWSLVRAAEVTGNDYLRLSTSSNPTYGVHTVPGRQALALSAAQFLVSLCSGARGN